jgi:hypothetical protein
MKYEDSYKWCVSKNHNLYASPNTIRVIKSKTMKWAGDVARMRDVKNALFWLESRKGRDHSKDLGVDGIIL